MTTPLSRLLSLVGLARVILADWWRYSSPLPPGVSSRRFEGLQVRLLLPDFIANGASGSGGLFKDLIATFCDDTGSEAIVVDRPYPGPYHEELELQFNSGLEMYDILLFSGSWMPSYAQRDWLMPLSSYLELYADEINWPDILPAIRRGVAEFSDEIYMLPADGAVIVMIVRQDLLDLHGLKKPETWEEWLAISRYFREQVGPDAWVDSPDRTLAQEGGYGACMLTKLNNGAHMSLFTFISTILQAHGPDQGIFFDPVTMDPFFDSIVVRKALQLYKDMVLNSSHSNHPCEACRDEGAGVDAMVEDWQAGRCMMALASVNLINRIIGGASDIGNSTIAVAPAPGSTWIRSTHGDGLLSCDRDLINCPYAVEVPRNAAEGRPHANGDVHHVNRATYYAGGGYAWAVSSHVTSDLKRRAVGELLMRLVSQTNPPLASASIEYSLEPYRESSLDSLQVVGHPSAHDYMAEGWTWQQLGQMQETLRWAFNDPNGVHDLKIHDAGSYLQDTDAILLRYIDGKVDLEQAIAELNRRWNARTAAVGINKQRSIYRQVFGLPPLMASSYCNSGQQSVDSYCVPCEAGRYGTGSGSCVLCQPGRYQSNEEQSTCDSCQDVLLGSTSLLFGARRPEECVCAVGSYWHQPGPNETASCSACQEGLVCPGGRQGADFTGPHRPPLQAEGYSAGIPKYHGGEPSYVVHCDGAKRCPGHTALGSCPEHAKGRACTCSDNSFDSGEVCSACDDESAFSLNLALLLPCLCGIILAACACWSGVVRDQWDRQNYVTVFVSASLAVSSLQTFAAAGQIGVDWVEPMETIRRIFEVLIFRFEIMKLPCFSGEAWSPALAYGITLMIYPVFLLMLLVVMLLRRCIGSTARTAEVLGTLGFVHNAIFISLAIVALLPWQCSSNPDGSFSVVSYRNVECWLSKQHIIMFTLSIVALLFNVLSFIAIVLWATRRHVVALTSEEGIGFQKFRFLFSRFRREKYYYAAIFAIRNLLVVLPTMLLTDQLVAEMFLLEIVVLGNILVQVRLWPWQGEVANVLDCILSSVISVVILGGSMMLNLEDHHGDGEAVLQVFILTSMLITALGMAGVMGRAALNSWHPRKRYGAFLSHHKASAGVLARWFKIHLLWYMKERVFLDSDDVEKLDLIVHVCTHDTKNVIILLTSTTLERIWCAAEIAGAVSSGTHIVLVACDGFGGIDSGVVANIFSSWTDHEKAMLANVGLTLEDIQHAYSTLQGRPTVEFDRHARLADQYDAVYETVLTCEGVRIFAALARRSSCSDRELSAASTKGQVESRFHILSNFDDVEAMYVGRVLKSLLQPVLQERVIVIEHRPNQLEEAPEENLRVEASNATFLHMPLDVSPLIPGCRVLVVVLSRGVLECLSAAILIARAGSTLEGVDLMPIRADDSFIYPDASFWKSLEEGEIVRAGSLAHWGCTLQSLVTGYKRLFGILALRFTSHASEKIQGAEIGIISARLRSMHGPPSLQSLGSKQQGSRSPSRVGSTRGNILSNKTNSTRGSSKVGSNKVRVRRSRRGHCDASLASSSLEAVEVGYNDSDENDIIVQISTTNSRAPENWIERWEFNC